jgi:hypothetical protein
MHLLVDEDMPVQRHCHAVSNGAELGVKPSSEPENEGEAYCALLFYKQ